MASPFDNTMISLTIDEVIINVKTGTTLLQAARQLGKDIPTLCYREGRRPDGSCRACVVEIENERVLAPSCRREAVDGMVVRTNSERVSTSRDLVLELLAVDAGCTRDHAQHISPESELASWLTTFGISTSNRFDILNAPDATIDASHPGFTFNSSACIQCDRCVRACQEEQVNSVIGVAGRGGASRIIFGLDESVAESPCVGCGECVQACPTGALMPVRQASNDVVKHVDSVCPYCGVGCALTFSVDDNKIIAVDGRDGPANHQRLCVKGRYGFDYIEHATRLSKPLIRLEGVTKDPSLLGQENLAQFDWRTLFREASWDEALAMAAEGLLKIRDKRGPQALAGFGSAKGSNEEAYLFQKLVRTGFQTNNVDHCTRLCHASSVAALLEGIGSGAVSNQVQDIVNADVALLIGCNPTVNHPVAATWMKNAANLGTRLLVADPRATEISRHASQFLQIKPGTDIALVNAMLFVIVNAGLIDPEFIAERVDGFNGFVEHIQAFSPERMSPICGISVDAIVQAAETYASADRAMIFWGMGVSQHTHGTDNVRALIALAGITGQFGRSGTGLHPLRGQNNVQGASDAGLIPMMYPSYQRVEDSSVRRWFEAHWGSALNPRAGLTVVEIMHHVQHAPSEEDRITGLYVMGENPAMSDPDLDHAREALAGLDHLVVQDIFLTETALLADVILPASAWPEKTGTVTNTDRMVQLGSQAVEPPGDARADLWIIQQLASRFGLPWDYNGPYYGVGQIFSEMRDAMGPSFNGITWDRLQSEQSVTYPCESTDSVGVGVMFVDQFPTSTGRLHLVPTQYRGPTEAVDSDYPFALITGRVLEHWHTGSMTRRATVLHQINPVPLVSIHPEDALILKVESGQPVSIRSRRGQIRAYATVDNSVAQGSVFLPFAFYEAAANLLTSDALDPSGKIPEFKHTPVQLECAQEEPVNSGF